MKRIVFIFLIMMVPQIGMSQIEFRIENITISMMTEELGENVIISEDFGADSPCLYIECSILNKNIHPITLYPSNAELFTTYIYNNHRYRKNVYTYCVFKYHPDSTYLSFTPDSLTIIQNQTIHLAYFHPRYLPDSYYLKLDRISPRQIRKFDHTNEVVKTLPTIKVNYKDKNTNIFTDKINNVSTKDLFFIH